MNDEIKIGGSPGNNIYNSWQHCLKAYMGSRTYSGTQRFFQKIPSYLEVNLLQPDLLFKRDFGVTYN
jgi:hypothetical protein